MVVFGLKSCDTCRATVKALREKGAEVTLVDVRESPLSDADLARFLDRFGASLVNRRSTTWRGLSEAERQDAPEALLRAHPALMKRPVIDTGAALYLGWGTPVREALL